MVFKKIKPDKDPVSKKQKIEYAARWFTLPDDERYPKTQKALAKYLGMTEQTICAWKGELFTSDNDEDEVAKFKANLAKLVLRPNAQVGHMQLYADIHNLRKQQVEVDLKIGLSADEVARRVREARRELEESGTRMDKMPGELSILPQDICKD